MAPTAFPLLGPPEIQHRPTARRRFVKPAPPRKGLTENGSATFLSSGDPLLDFFFQVVPDTPANTVTALFSAAWDRDPLFALKLACHLRAVRGTGKNNRKGFYAAALWLHRHHPKTLALNAAAIAGFGYLKDLLEILHRLIAPRSRRRIRPKIQSRNLNTRQKRRKTNETKEERLIAEMAKVKIQVEHARELRHQKRATMAAKAVKRYARDPNYRFFHDCTSELFATLLVSDLNHWKSGEYQAISLAAKWCPSLDRSYDRSTLICESIARRIFPRDANAAYSSIDEAHYAYRVRERLRHEVWVRQLRDDEGTSCVPCSFGIAMKRSCNEAGL